MRGVKGEDSLRSELEDIRRESNDLRGLQRRAEGEITAHREEERKKHSRVELAQRETQSALTSLRAAEADLRDIQREMQRRQHDVDSRKDAVRKAYEREGLMATELDDTARSMRDAEKSVSSIEETLERQAEKERSAVQNHRSCVDNIRECEEALDRLSRELRTSDENVHAAAGQIDACQDEMRALADEFEEIERDSAAFLAHRDSTAQEETELLQEEIQLRHQRLQLETRESRLRNKTYTQKKATSSPSPSRSPSPPRGHHFSPHHSPRTFRTMSPEDPSKKWATTPQRIPLPAATPRTEAYTPYLRASSTTNSVTPRRAVGSGAGTSPHRVHLREGTPGKYGTPYRSISRRSEKEEGGEEEKEIKGVKGDAADNAAKMHRAMKGFGTDEAAIFGVLAKLRGAAEWGELKAAFARAHPMFYGGDVVKALQADLTKRELEKCVATLKDKNITM